MKISGNELYQSYSGMSRTSSQNTSSSDSEKSGDSKPGLPVAKQGSSEKTGSIEGKMESGTSQTGQNGNKELNTEELAVVNELKQTDKKVRAHEAAHVAVGGQYVTGGPSFEYKTGPDGKQYAVGGEVQIDTSEVPNDPDATIAKMEVVKKAALAPGSPSPQDRSVAAAASRIEAQARIEASSATKDGDKTVSNKQVGQNIDRKA